jgi:hypothetical protein
MTFAVGLGSQANADEFKQYQFEPRKYIDEKLGWQPWQGKDGKPGQVEVIDAYTDAIRQQLERRKYEHGEAWDESVWKPGQTIKNRIRIEAGHTVGKTKLASGLVSHFFDCFPSIIYTFAPSWDQIKDLLWKEIATDRRVNALPGRVLDTCEIKASPDHFAKGRATNDSHGRGTERVQGQHHSHLLFILDEAEGVADYVYDAIDSMASGGIAIVLLLANPRTRTSRFYKASAHSNVQSFRISCLNHPNVREGREIIPGAVTRQYVDDMLEKHCETTGAHDADAFTFEIDWKPGTIFAPDSEFLFRVLGIAPANTADKCLVPVGRFEAAVKREPPVDRPEIARLGVDAARFGNDYGTLYVRWNGRVWRAAKFTKETTGDYKREVRRVALELKEKGVKSLHVRVDGGGGFGGGLVDSLNSDGELRASFDDFQVLEVHFNATPKDETKFDDAITEWTASTAEALKDLAVLSPPESLQSDLCERLYDWVDRGKNEFKQLESKKKFRKRQKPERSPDDGDGFVLAVASDRLFSPNIALCG